MKGGRNQRKIRNLLLDRGFQLKYAAFALGLSTLLSTALGFFWFRQMKENSRMVLLNGDFDPAFAQALAASDAQAVGSLVLMVILFNLFLAIGTIVLTHRVAGPIFVFRRFLREIEAGGFPSIRDLRKGDEFTGTHRQLRFTVDALRARAAADAALGRQILGCLEAGEVERARSDIRRWVDDKSLAVGTLTSQETGERTS